MDKKVELANYIESVLVHVRKSYYTGVAIPPDFTSRVAEECITILSGENTQTIEDHVAKIRELAKKKHNCKVDVTINYHE